MPAERDFVDHLIDEWNSEAPDLDVTPFAIIVRMKRATACFDKARERLGAPYGLGGGEIMVLDALRRVGLPNRLSPGRLLKELLIPSGTMTSWIDRLAERGFVKRIPDPHDRRGVLVQLAPGAGEWCATSIDWQSNSGTTCPNMRCWRGSREGSQHACRSPSESYARVRKC